MEMESKKRATVFFVDNRRDLQEIVASTLQDVDVEVVCMSSAKECLKAFPSQRCDLLITDVKMPDMDGIELLREVRKMAPLLPVIAISGYADVEIVVQAMKMGAIDFIEKPLSRKPLLATVKDTLSHTSSDNQYASPLQPLTKIENQTLVLILEGKSNREIADIRHRSKRTVEDERRRIMKKLGARNIIDLVRIASAMGLSES